MSLEAIADARISPLLARGFIPAQLWDTPCRPWRVVQSAEFEESMSRMSVVFPDLTHKLRKFLDCKRDDPQSIRFGKHDRRMTGPLKRFYHCHLRDDAVLIYGLANRVLTLIYVAPHAEIEGKRLRMTARRISHLS